MAHTKVSPVTQETITDMIAASREMAHTLGMIRGKFLSIDGDLARKTEALRRRFEGFAVAAQAGKVVDPVTLETLGRVYEDMAGVVGELAHARSYMTARGYLSTALGLALLCMTLVESGPDPVFSA
jgi:hypothetical protein